MKKRAKIMSESSLLGVNNRGMHKMEKCVLVPSLKQNTEFQKFCQSVSGQEHLF